MKLANYSICAKIDLCNASKLNFFVQEALNKFKVILFIHNQCANNYPHFAS